jgi:para-aminobenzoate synthetase
VGRTRGYFAAMAGTRQTEAPTVSAGPELLVERLDVLYDAERAFASLYGASPNAFWLDSSAVGKRGRFSFMGDSEGPLGAVVLYDVTAGQVRVERGGAVEVFDESIFDYLARELGRVRHLSVGLPFDFDCGFAGYFGYELKADCDGVAAHRAETPDAAFVFADRLIAFDHEARRTYLLSLVEPKPELHQLIDLAGREVDAVRLVAEAERWIDETSRRLAALPSPAEPDAGDEPVVLHLRRSRDRYLDDIAACKRHLEVGHSYEICLTDKVLVPPVQRPLDLYRALRRANPAPFAAFLRFGDLAVLSSSPERFLRIDRDRWAEARPIKGTSRRGETQEEDARLAAQLLADAKSRAENVTIVDLMRNDLGRVCEFGTVEVPELMRVETYETVHQLVSSVRGRLREELGPLDCIRACFPPGSMTGAPKVRTMEIIDELEGEARGAYSGAIGFLGLSGGCDLGVTIRTIVIDGDSATIGAGGAIVMQSDPEGELEEMLLKARAPIAAIDPGATVSFPFAAGSRPQPDSAPDPIE